MTELTLKSKILEVQLDELTEEECLLVKQAIAMTDSSYAPHSHFHVGAAVLLANGKVVSGSNQENAVLPAGICAERTAIFAANSNYPDVAIRMLAIAARNAHGELTPMPVSPCGICRQVIVETETRFRQPVRILLYGKEKIYVVDGIRELMPLAFTEF